jgi:hypothetical protein
MALKLAAKIVMSLVCVVAYVSRVDAYCYAPPKPRIDSPFIYTTTFLKALAVLKSTIETMDSAKDLANPEDSKEAFQSAISGYNCIVYYLSPYRIPCADPMKRKPTAISLSAEGLSAVVLTLKPVAERDLVQLRNRMEGQNDNTLDVTATEKDRQVRARLGWLALRNAVSAAAMATWTFDDEQRRTVSVFTEAERTELLARFGEIFGDLSSGDATLPPLQHSVTILRDCLADETKYPSRQGT